MLQGALVCSLALFGATLSRPARGAVIAGTWQHQRRLETIILKMEFEN